MKFEKSYLRGKEIKFFSFFPIQCKVFRDKVLKGCGTSKRKFFETVIL